jgi:4-aminobutyrate aminotransferase-like enzyme
MSSPSVSYAESVLSHLEKVQQLPVEVQVGIARRVESCIKIARAAKNEAVVASHRFHHGRTGQGHRARDDGPAMGYTSNSEAWCYATMSLTKGYLDRLHAQAIIGAIEAFTSSRLSN